MVRNGSVEYAVHWETIEQLNRSYHLSIATLERVQTKRVSQSSLLNPFSWAMPDVVSLEVDWDGARAAADAANVADMFHFSATASRSMADVGRTMLERVNVAQRNKDGFRQLSRSVNQQNMANIAGAVDNYEGLIDASRFVRDTSGDVVCIGATFLTGGAAAGVLVGGSALKGTAKYQDTGSVGQTIGTVTSSVVFGAFKVGPGFGLAKLTGKEEYILILAQGVYEGASTYMSGKPFTEAAAKAGAKIAAEAGLKRLFKVPLVKTLFEKLPLPIVWVPDKASSLGERWVDKASDVAMKATEKTAANFTSKVGLPAVGRAVMGSGGSASNTTSQDSNPVADAIIHDEMLLKFAICRMDRGIGHGW